MTRLARYQPPSIPPQVLVALVLLFALLSFVRGLDYAVNGDVAQSLVVLNALSDLRIWGVWIMAAAAAVVTSYALRRHFLIWLAHVVMAALQLCIAVTVAQAIRELGVGGWSAFVLPAGAFLWHAVLAALTRPFPRGAGHGT